MPLRVDGRGKRLALAGRLLVRPTAPARWLIGLRWAAIAGMGITSLAAGHYVPALNVRPVFSLLGALAVLNLLWLFIVRRSADRPSVTLAPQIIVDVMALSAVLWLTGGVTNPFACFLAFQIVLAGLLGTARTTVTVTALTVLALFPLAAAAPLDLSGSPVGAERAMLVAETVSLGALGAFTGFFVYVYQQRLQAFREAGARSEKLAALGRTLGAMAHELNTPLGTLVLAGREVALIGGELAHAEVQRLGETIHDESTRASDIIALLRGYVRPDARNEVIDLGVFVPTWVERELDRLRFTGERVVRVGSEVQVPAIRVALGQVLTNVLRNAVEAMEPGPVRRLEVDVLGNEREVAISVRDSGPGVDPRLLPSLGEPFQTTKEETGTGLGLYVSTLLAERMGGSLQLESGPERGTRVTLTLPRQP